MSEVPSNLQDMMTKYDSYLEETLNGKMGKTAQFWMTYAEIVGLIQLMQCAIKINDIALYSFALFEVTSIFFTTNHHDYACWMYLYSLDIANLETSQSDLQNILTEGGFRASIERENHLLVSLLIWLLNKQSMQMQRTR